MSDPNGFKNSRVLKIVLLLTIFVIFIQFTNNWFKKQVADSPSPSPAAHLPAVAPTGEHPELSFPNNNAVIAEDKSPEDVMATPGGSQPRTPSFEQTTNQEIIYEFPIATDNLVQ